MINIQLTADQESHLVKTITRRAEQAKLLQVFRQELGKCHKSMKAELELQNESLIRDKLLRHSYQPESAPPCSSSSAVDPINSNINYEDIYTPTLDNYYCNPISNRKT